MITNDFKYGAVAFVLQFSKPLVYGEPYDAGTHTDSLLLYAQQKKGWCKGKFLVESTQLESKSIQTRFPLSI